MKFNRSSQLLLVSAASLLAASLITACGTLTVDFVYVTSAKAAGPNSYGEVDVFEINSESGHMRQIPTSPFPSGGRNPVAEAPSPDNTNLYIINQDDNTIVQFVIGNDGKLYPQNTNNTPGVFPLAMAVSGSNLFVADTYQPLPSCSPASPCSGSVAVFPILNATQAKALTPSQPADTLQPNTPINSCTGLYYLPLNLTGAASNHVILPTALSASADGSVLFVSGYDTTANAGYLFVFTVGTLSCPNNPAQYQTIPTLTALAGSPFSAGTHPSGIAANGNYLYVTDYAKGQVLSYQVNAGVLTLVSSSGTGGLPAAIAVDTTGKFAYVANSQDSNLTAYSISNGALTHIATYGTGTQPVAIGIDPSKNQFIYTANFLGNTVSGFEVNPADGSLLVSQLSPFAANANPTAVAAIPHGSVAK